MGQVGMEVSGARAKGGQIRSQERAGSVVGPQSQTFIYLGFFFFFGDGGHGRKQIENHCYRDAWSKSQII